MFKPLLIVFLVSAAAAVQASPPAELDAMRHALTRAAAAHDREGMATHMAFPLALDNYGSPPSVTRGAFLGSARYFTVIFGGGDEELLKCIASTPVTLQTDPKAFGGRTWLADCNGNEYFFALRGGGWRLVAYQNINE